MQAIFDKLAEAKSWDDLMQIVAEIVNTILTYIFNKEYPEDAE